MGSLKGGFLVNGDPGATIHLDAVWSFREARYSNEVDVFAVDNLGRVNGIAPGEPGYGEAALRSESRRTLLQSGEQTGAWESFDALAGSQLALYLIQNDSITNWLGRNNKGAANVPVLFSIETANPSGLERMRSADLGKGLWSFAWEDLITNSDDDFNDIVLQVGPPGFVVPGESGGSALLTVNRLEKESAYLSEMGIYFTDTAAGRVGGLDPGDPGYREAVLAQVRLRKLFAADPPGAQASLELPSTTSFGWYLIANGSTESLAQGQGEMFFSHAAANRDGLSHIHARGDADKTLQVAGLATDMFRSLEAPEGFNRLNPIRWQPELVLQHVAQLGDHHLAGEQGVVGEHLLQQVGAETAGREGAHQHIRVEEQAHQLGGCSAQEITANTSSSVRKPAASAKGMVWVRRRSKRINCSWQRRVAASATGLGGRGGC